jgi:ATP-dependent protease ClpP protease subunit
MMKIIFESSGLTPSFVKKNILTPSDIYLSAEEMLEMGFSDHILLGGDQF